MAVQSPLFSFVSDGLDSGTFHVVRFRGQEGLSSLYRFEILLLSEDTEIDLGVVLNSAATFTIHAADGRQDSPYHGVLEGFQQLQRVDEHVLYRAVLVPKLWRLTLTSHNQISLGKTPREIITTCLEDGGLLTPDFETRVQEQEDPCDYVCQYNESHYQFFSRWAERYGYYYHFDQSGASEKLIVTNTRMAHGPLQGQPVLNYADMSGLDALEADHVVKDFTMTVSPLPQKVKLKSYNYEKPDLDLQVEQEVDARGAGEIYACGEEFLTLDEGRRLVNLRVEELRCRSRLFDGVSNIAFMSPGYTFTLRGHYRPDCNDDYLITSVTHEGGQEAFLSSGLGVSLPGSEDRPSYRNRFQCIPAAVQYRPPRATAAPRIAGTLHAKIDAAGSGEYAELDEQGRYKVIMPFDLSGRSNGKASVWLRKAEPYAGSNHGMHFPLHKGTEVMIAFIDGDPNRPYILSAIANPNTPSVITDETQTQNRITTAGGNRLHFEDSEGKQNVLLSTPAADSSILMGSNNSESEGKKTKQELEEKIEQNEKKIEEAEAKRKELEKDEERNREEIRELTDQIEKYELQNSVWEIEKENAEGEEKFLGIGIKTGEKVKVEAGSYDSFLSGNEFKMILGGSEEVVVGTVDSVVGGNESSVVAGLETSVVGGDEISVVVGLSREIVGGQDLSVVLGGKHEFTGGLLTDIILGGVLEFNYPEKWEFSEAHTEMAKMKTEIDELKDELSKSNTRIAEVETSLTETTTKVNNTEEVVNRTQTKIIMSEVKTNLELREIRESVSSVTKTVDQCNESVNSISGKVNTISENLIWMGSSTFM